MHHCIMCGAKSSWDIREYAAYREEWLRKFLPLYNGIPSRLTFERVLRILDPKRFAAVFTQIMQGVQTLTRGEIVSLDGKKYFKSAKEDGTIKPLYMVSAWCSHNGLSLGHIQTESKSNEITAMPELLRILDVRNAVVTGDAAACQRNIAKIIIEEKKADYVLALKENQPAMLEEMSLYARDCLSDSSLSKKYDHIQTLDKGHGRLEKRDYYLFHDLSWFAGGKAWAGLRGLILVRSERTVGNTQPTREERYYITSLCEVNQAAHAVRYHWGIENKLHWVLDVVFREDQWKTRKETAAANLATIRKLAFSFLRKDQSSKLSGPQKMWRCFLDQDFLSDILFNNPIFS